MCDYVGGVLMVVMFHVINCGCVIYYFTYVAGVEMLVMVQTIFFK